MFYFFIAGVIVTMALFFSACWYLFKFLVALYVITNPKIIQSLKIFSIILPIFFIIATTIVFRYNNIFTNALNYIANFLMGLIFYLYLALGIGWIVLSIAKSFSPKVPQKFIVSLLLILAPLTCVYGIYNAKKLQVTKIPVNLTNLPLSWRGKTAVWISDIHLGQIEKYKFAEQVADQVQALQPELVFIGGDLYDGDKADLNKLIEPLAKLKAPSGIYFITGNHEEFTDNKKYLEAISRAGIKILNNEMVNLNGLQIVGVDYHDSGNKEEYQSILSSLKINQNQPSILLKHSPFRPEIAEKAGIFLQLSGHTHNGQIFPVGLITDWIFRGYSNGLKKLGGLTVYTSSGTGTWGPPLRIGTKAELVLVEFN